MAGDWIKMQTTLYRHPKVIAIADYLMDDNSDLARYVSQNLQRNMTVTRNVTRNATVGALVTVWGTVRQTGKRSDNDITIENASLATLDDISELPGFGVAMASVGWALETEKGVVFPNFYEDNNVDPNAKNAQRQQRYRDKKKAEESNKRNVTRNVTRNDRVEKSRVENITPIVPKGTVYSDAFETFWSVFPSKRKSSKRSAYKAWQSALKRKPADEIISVAREYAASDKGRGQYASGPSPWLNGDCWDDDRESWRSKDSKPGALPDDFYGPVVVGNGGDF